MRSKKEATEEDISLRLWCDVQVFLVKARKSLSRVYNNHRRKIVRPYKISGEVFVHALTAKQAPLVSFNRFFVM